MTFFHCRKASGFGSSSRSMGATAIAARVSQRIRRRAACSTTHSMHSLVLAFVCRGDKGWRSRSVPLAALVKKRLRRASGRSSSRLLCVAQQRAPSVLAPDTGPVVAIAFLTPCPFACSIDEYHASPFTKCSTPRSCRTRFIPMRSHLHAAGHTPSLRRDCRLRGWLARMHHGLRCAQSWQRLPSSS